MTTIATGYKKRRKEYMKAYSQINRERINANRRRNYWKNREHILERRRLQRLNK